MRLNSLLLTVFVTSFSLSPASFAQNQGHHDSHAYSGQVTPGSAWLSIEENLRNLTDALKKDDLAAIPGFVASMSAANDVLMSSNIHDEVKPNEEEHLLNSLRHLKKEIDSLIDVSASDDKAVIEAAVTRVSGAITLTKIDVPPGLLEKISGAGVRAEIVNTPVLQKGKESTVTLRLKSAITGKPLKSEDLEIVHTEIVHALIIDPQLTDYTHVHPIEIDVPGEYTLTINPQSDCTYRLWADVTPTKGKQEYAMVDIPGRDGCGSQPVDTTESLTATVDGYTVNLKLPEKGLKLKQENMLTFSVINASGAADALEPIMGAYAHVVGFQDDYRTIAHLHPMGDEPKTSEDRGASPLSFHFKPERTGFVKLFMQIRVDGKEHVFPFGVTVQD